MPQSLAIAAAANNAAWCDAVCRTHGRAGEYTPALWLHRGQVPPLYPNAITLLPGHSEQQREAIAGLHVAGAWAVKDSFAELDLTGLGFGELFTARWLRVPDARQRSRVSGAQWRRVEDAAALAAWEEAWGQRPVATAQALFHAALLCEPDVSVLGAWSGGRVVAGAIAFRAAGVVGLSNVFVAPGAPGWLLEEALHAGGAAFPGLPLVGYEHGGDLDAWLALGAEPLGALRVWLKR